MKTTIAILAVLLSAGILAAEGQAQTFEGEYDWAQGGSDFLSAKFEPAGEDEWKIAFRFKWNGSDYTWKGKASGSLADGSDLTGTVRSDRGGRTWDFTASIEDGVLTGQHIETTGDRKYETGTFSMKR